MSDTRRTFREGWSLFRSKPVHYLSPEKLEAKRREQFGYAYEELVRHVEAD